jgi:hypothetical protein
MESSERGELILVDNGYCRFHIRKDNILKIYEIISQKPGVGSKMLEMLKEYNIPIVAKCPKHLASNAWYVKKGFTLYDEDDKFNVWKYE